jgi:hypothetical protein
LTDVATVIENNEAVWSRFAEGIAKALQPTIEFLTAGAEVAAQLVTWEMAQNQLIDTMLAFADGQAETVTAAEDSIDPLQGSTDILVRANEAALELARSHPQLTTEIEKTANAAREATAKIEHWQTGLEMTETKVYDNEAAAFAFVHALAQLEMTSTAVVEAETRAIKAHDLEAAALKEVAAATDDATAAEAQYQSMKARGAAIVASRRNQTMANIRALRAERAELAAQIDAARASGAGSGADIGAQMARRNADEARRRSEDARMAALDIQSWNRDQNQWIARNEAGLSEEMQAQFAARTAAAQAEADRIKETNAKLAMDLLGVEKWYQSEAARIAKIKDDDERARQQGILEEEYNDKRNDLQARAELEAQIAEERKQAEIEAMRQAGAAGGSAFVDQLVARWEEVDGKLRTMLDHWIPEVGKPWEAMIEGTDDASLNMSTTFGPGTKWFTGPIDAAETLEEKIRLIADAGREALNELNKLQSAGNQHGLAQYQTGGFVAGPMNKPQLAVVHGGEEIIPTNRAAGGSGIIVQMLGPVYTSSPAQAEAVGMDLGRGIQQALRTRGLNI